MGKVFTCNACCRNSSQEKKENKVLFLRREIIDIEAGKVFLMDALFRTWLKDHYFRNR